MLLVPLTRLVISMAASLCGVLATARQNMKVALVVGLIGFLIVGAALTVPRLAEGEPLKATPLFGGQVPVVETDNDGDGIADADDPEPLNPDVPAPQEGA